MIQRNVVLISLLLVTQLSSAVAEAILASDFNKQFSCANPFIATETTTIILNVDITIEGICELIKAGPGFSQNDRIIFTSATNNRVVITKGSTWKIGLTTQFTGNARLEKEPQATLYLQNNVKLFMSEKSIYFPIPFA